MGHLGHYMCTVPIHANMSDILHVCPHLEYLNFEPGGHLWHHVLVTVLQDGSTQREGSGSAPQLDLEHLFAGWLQEDTREELGAGLHAVLVAGLLAIALQGNEARGCVNEAANEHALRGTLATRFAAHLSMQLISTEHVATVTLNSVNNKRLSVKVI